MAFDHMSVKLGDFKKAAAFQPAIAKLLAHTEDKEDK
jgi:ribonuclease Z